MAPKPLAPLARRLFKGVVLLEVAGVLGAYGLFYKMNTSQGIIYILYRKDVMDSTLGYVHLCNNIFCF